MGMTELRERGGQGSQHSIKAKLKEVKMLLADICEEIEEKDEEFGERRGYRIYEDDKYGERMGRRMY